MFAAWADLHDCDPAALDVFAGAYLGHYPSAADYARDLVDEAGYTSDLDRLIPEPWRPYVTFDAERLVHDMQLEGSIVVYPDEQGSGVWIFDVY